MNEKNRMYEVNGKTVRTWNVFKGCQFDCIYCVQREQAKRQKHRCEKCYAYKPHMHLERLNEKFKEGETVFVAAAGDISFANSEQFVNVLDVIGNNPKTTFYLQSKNPEWFLKGVVYPQNIILGTTIETNWGFTISKAPSPISRNFAMATIKHRKYLAIEPIMDFDERTLMEWVKRIKPEFVYVGYLNPLGKAKKLHLPEPSLEKTMKLCKALKGLTEVRFKSMRKAYYE